MRHRYQRVFTNFKLYAFEFKQFAVLLIERILWLSQNGDQGILIEFFKGRDHRQAPNKLGNQSIFNEILGLQVLQKQTH